jgi:methylglutamate dehydrogenase subunit D
MSSCATLFSMIQREDANVTDLNWIPVSPLQQTTIVHATSATHVGIQLTEIRDFAAVQIMARRGKLAQTVKAAKVAFGVSPASAPKLVQGKNASLIWSGPDQFIALSSISARLSHGELIQHFGTSASLSEQSDGRVIVSITGPKVRDMLAKVCSLDLHPQVFPVGTAAVTAIDHLSTNIWRDADNDAGHAVFKLLFLSTFAVSLWGLLVDSSAEYGVKIETRAY